MFAKRKPEFTGKLLVDKALAVKDLPPIKQISAGVDHFLCLDTKGQVWAMGDDTFGQCG